MILRNSLCIVTDYDDDYKYGICYKSNTVASTVMAQSVVM